MNEATRAVRWLPAVDSTNRWLKEHAGGLPGGTMCCTLNQTAGRGRLGREWMAADGAALAMSLLIKPVAGEAPVPLVFGLAAAEALRALTGLDMKIKWPNDIVCSGRKVCGILCELLSGRPDSCVVAGIGVNLYQTADNMRAAGLENAASLVMLAGGEQPVPEPPVIAEAIADAFERLYAQPDIAPLKRRYEALCATLGGDVRVLGPDGAALLEGEADGIDEAGRLLVRTAGGLRAVSAGEVSVRGADGRYA